MKKLISFLFILVFYKSFSQELKCTVKINTDKISATNTNVFKTLETSLNEFVNKTIWTKDEYKPNEKINCSMTLIIDSYENTSFTGSLQVQSSRPGFNSTYSSPITNFNDKNFNFSYVEFENLLFNNNSFDSNLVGVISFYCYVIIGIDRDSFSKLGGTSALEAAQNIANLGQTSSYKGWSQNDGNNSRFFLINDLLSGTFSSYRDAIYTYHFSGIDLMSSDQSKAKENIIIALNQMKKVHEVRPNAFLTRVFFDAKSDEIVSIFSGGSKIPLEETINVLNRINPMNSEKWNSIKN